MKRRVSVLEELTATGSALDASRRAAYEKVTQAIEIFKRADGSYPIRKRRLNLGFGSIPHPPSGWELIAYKHNEVAKLLGDLNHIVWHHTSALDFADWILNTAPEGSGTYDLRSWRDKLSTFTSLIVADQLLGSYVISRCWATLHNTSNFEDREELRDLLAVDPSQKVIIVKDAATSLIPRMMEVSPVKSSSHRGRPAKIVKDSTAPTSILTVEKWDELAIGIHEKGFYALPKCPPPGGIVAITRQIKLPLPGKRWPAVLDCFARSDDGKTVRKDELLSASRLPQGW